MMYIETCSFSILTVLYMSQFFYNCQEYPWNLVFKSAWRMERSRHSLNLSDSVK